ncbi:submandibular gland protein C-like isoform X4 [Peromyscus leucopus]|uniref:submandibular gland protein C-like isoform X4 n=1 Tax=Peromyscus leucopus TaxID=10041 RepID=UPI001884C23F|nr:submandibular gland protein C-like isoform X4 [Peromyscus leucopus]
MPRSQIITMKLILLCLAVVLCTFGKGTAGVRFGSRFGVNANANLKSSVGLSPKTKSADGDKHDNVPAGDEATMESKSNIGTGAIIDLNSILRFESPIKTIVSALAKGKYLLDKLTGILPAENSISKSFEKLLGGAMAIAGGSGDATAETKLQPSLGVVTTSGAESPEAVASNMLKTLEAIVNNHRDNAGTSGSDATAESKLQSLLGVDTATGGDQKLQVGMHNGDGRKVLLEPLAEEVGREVHASDSGVSGSQHSLVGVTTGSEGHLNLKDEKAPEVNGNEVDGQNSSDSSETGSMDVGNKNDSGTNVASPGPHDSAGSVVSGRCTCSTD